MLPIANTDRMLMEQVGEETIVYDQARDKAHCLNRAAALVWRQCDGQTSVGEMAQRLHRDLDLPADEALVWLALDRLKKAHLLQVSLPRESPTYTRREVARRLGLVGSLALALPLVTSLAAPTPAEAQSPGRLGDGAGCTANSQCASGCCQKNQLQCIPAQTDSSACL